MGMAIAAIIRIVSRLTAPRSSWWTRFSSRASIVTVLRSVRRTAPAGCLQLQEPPKQTPVYYTLSRVQTPDDRQPQPLLLIGQRGLWQLHERPGNQQARQVVGQADHSRAGPHQKRHHRQYDGQDQHIINRRRAYPAPYQQLRPVIYPHTVILARLGQSRNGKRPIRGTSPPLDVQSFLVRTFHSCSETRTIAFIGRRPQELASPQPRSQHVMELAKPSMRHRHQPAPAWP